MSRPQVGKAAAVPGLYRSIGAEYQAVLIALLVHGDPVTVVARDGQRVGFVGLEFHGSGLSEEGIRTLTRQYDPLGITTLWY